MSHQQTTDVGALRPEAPRVKRLRSDSSISSVTSRSTTKPGSIHLGEDESPRMEPVSSRFLWDVSQGDSIVMGVTATPKARAATLVSEGVSPRGKEFAVPQSNSKTFSLAGMNPLDLTAENPTDVVAEPDEYEVLSRQGSEEWTTTVLRGVRSGKELTLEHVGFNLVEVTVDGDETFTARHNKLQVFASDESIVAARLNR